MIRELQNESYLHLVALFGSYRTGSYSYGSDVDLAIIYDDSTPLTFERALTLALGSSAEADWQLHLYSFSDFKKGLLNGNDFLKTILDQGQILLVSKKFSSITL